MIALISELLTQVLRLVPFISAPDPHAELQVMLAIQRRISDELAQRDLR